MPGDHQPLQLKPSFEAEFPNDGVQWQDENSARLYESGQKAISDVTRPLEQEVELVTIPEPDAASTIVAKVPAAKSHRRQHPISRPSRSDFAHDSKGDEVPYNLR